MENLIIQLLLTVAMLTGGGSAITNFVQDKMGVPSGTSYVVVTTKEVVRSAPVECGYNDLGLPNMGVFTQELREYTEYKDGNVLRTRNETAENFTRCYQP